MNIADIVSGFAPEVEEAGAGPSRIVKHIKDGTPFLMLSAFRADNKHATNLKQHAKMKQLLSGFPMLSYIQTTGEYKELGSNEPKEELSFFIMGKRPGVTPQQLAKIGTKLMHAFNQDAVLLGDGEDVSLVFSDGSIASQGNRLTFRPEIISKLGGHSVLKGRKFSFTKPDNKDASNKAIPGAATYGQQMAA